VTSFKKEFGLNVARYRKEAGLTQEQLAERCGVVLQTIGHIERGKHGPRFDLLEKLCEVLEVHPKQLFDF